MCHAFTKQGVFGGDFIEVGVEVITGNTAEIDYIGLGYGASVGDQGFADFQLIKGFSEGMYRARFRCGTGGELTCVNLLEIATKQIISHSTL